MSDKKGLGGLFVNKKSDAPTIAGGTSRPKNVKQRWLMVAGVSAGFLVMASSFFSAKPPAQVVHKKPEVMVSVNPKGVDNAVMRETIGVDVKRVERENEELRSKLSSLTEAVEKLKHQKDSPAVTPGTGALPPGIVPPPSATGTPPSPSTAVMPPPPPVLPTREVAPPRVSSPSLPPVPSLDGQPSFAVPAEPQVFKPEAKPVTKAAESGDVVKSTVQYKKNPYNGFLPAGAFASVVLLNGLDAGTSSATQANPMPVLMNITDQATLPGSARYMLKSCFVLGTGYGDLSAERVYVRFSRLSCLDKQDRLVLSADVAGYLVDSDGKIGLRGKVLDRQGAKLGKALLAGFAQGLSGALGQAQGVVTSTAAGMTSAIGGDAALRASGLSGAQSAAQQLAQFYLKEAQGIFPVISIDTGRTATIVFTDNASLVWSTGDTQYVKDVRPAE